MTNHHAAGRKPSTYRQTPPLTGSLAKLREAGRLICQCPTPDGEDDGECQRCRKLILTPARLQFLREKYRPC
jgi:hypothetical protein